MPLLALLSAPYVALPTDANTNVLILLRWIHFLAGITWVGLLYFFNLVNVPFLKEVDPAVKGRVVHSLMPRALWWFRWSAVVTVLAGLTYWMRIASVDAHNAHATPGAAMWSFFAIWTVAFVLEMAVLMQPNAALRRGPVLGIIVAVVVIAAAWLFLSLNAHGWESNRLLAIGIGGGLGWFMMLNVWGLIWRMQKKIIRWTDQNLRDGTPMPPQAAGVARLAFLVSRVNAWLSIPMLFFMAAASHYPMFGALR